jgi:hypothetical protein
LSPRIHLTQAKPVSSKNINAVCMMPTNDAQIERLDQNEKLEELVSKLWKDEKLQKFATECDTLKQPACFDIKGQKEFNAYVEQHLPVSTKQ